MTSIYEMVTQRILDELSRGIVPWQKPWVGGGGTYNVLSHRPYSALNSMLLRHSGAYGTVRAWNSINGRVKVGERAEIVTFWKKLEPEEDTEEGKEGEIQKPRFVLRHYPVFHESQISGAIIPERKKLERFEHNPIVEAEEVFHGYIKSQGIQFRQEESDKAYYSPADDLIHVPLPTQFPNPIARYNVCFHEATHSTALAKRCGRPLVGHSAFMSADYSKEELVAELSSQYILHSLGINTDETLQNSASYIESWLTALRTADSRMIVSASIAAEKSARFILDAAGWQNPETSNAAAQQ